MPEQTQVSAPARLHFGLFSIGKQTQVRFGGAGLMLDGPRTVVTARGCDRLVIEDCSGGEDSDPSGPSRSLLVDSLTSAVHRWFEHTQMLLPDVCQPQELPLRLTIESRAQRHVGLGSGTQLTLATVVSAAAHLDIPLPTVSELGAITGRGRRSAIGSHGFWSGGFLVDRGKTQDDDLAPLDLQFEFPQRWPIVTLIPEKSAGLSGAQEKEAFRTLPETTEDERIQMTRLVRDEIAPAILNQDYERFAVGLRRFGQQSGAMFAAAQQGNYNGPVVTQLVETVINLGVPAVGQSSWGPCVFAICPDPAAAHRLVAQLLERSDSTVQISVRHADNQGVRIESQ